MLVYYFVIQSLGRVVILYSWIARRLFFLASYLTLLRVLLKLGVFPFHSWYLNLINYLNLDRFWVLRILIKFIPLKLLLILSSSHLYLILGLANIILAFFSVFKEIKIVTFLGFSSIFNMGWVFQGILTQWNWLIYLLLYGITLKLLIVALNVNGLKSFFIGVVNSSKHQSLFSIVCALVIIGIPPFPGFVIKVVIFLTLIDYSLILGCLRLLVTLVITFYYLILFFYLSLKFEDSYFGLSIKISNEPLRLLVVNLFLSPFVYMYLIYYLNNKLS